MSRKRNNLAVSQMKRCTKIGQDCSSSVEGQKGEGAIKMGHTNSSIAEGQGEEYSDGSRWKQYRSEERG